MNILILGGTGFIGSALVRALLARDGTVVTTPSRSPHKYRPLCRNHSIPFWDGRNADGLIPLLAQTDAVVNLTGENIAGHRWDEQTRSRILSSRVQTGQRLSDAFKKTAIRPRVLVQASACGYYGGWPDHTAPCLTESAPPGQTFLASVCKAWEESTRPVEELGIRRCIIRTSPVLGPGGLLARLLPLFRLGLGGPVGTGTQPFPWIHLDDEVGAILHLLDNEPCAGPYNLGAPAKNTMAEFSRELGKALRRPAFLRIPSFAVRLAYGQMGEELLLNGQISYPARLGQAGYVFRRPTLKAAFEAPGVFPGDKRTS